MAGVKPALAILLATCFASTFAVIKDCTFDNINDCTKPVYDLDGSLDTDAICMAKRRAKDCLHNLQPGCTDASHGAEKYNIEELLGTFNQDLSSCPEDTNHEKTTMKTTKMIYDSTTRYPVSEPDYPECTWSNYDKCINPLIAVLGVSDDYTKCSTWANAKDCMKKMWEMCDEGDVEEQLKRTWEDYSRTMAYCDHYWTTRYPASEPHHDWSTRYPTAEPEPGYKCTWQAIQTCSARGTELSSETDKTKICSISHEMKKCFDWFADDCRDEGMINTVRNVMTSLRTVMDMCPKTDECSKDKYDYCTNPLTNLEGNPNNLSPEEMCRVWWDGKACYAYFYDECPAGGEIRNNIDMTWYHMESAMAFCKGYAMCSEDERKACTRDMMEHKYDMKEKCNAAGRAKDCLKDLSKECKDKFVMMMIEYESMPKVKDVMEQCMYGHGDGWDNGPHYASAQSTKALPILALLLAIVAKMVSRF